MTQKTVAKWLSWLMAIALWGMAVTASIMVLGFTAGYATEKYAQAQRCARGMCDDGACRPHPRFIKRKGCER
jgi:hypothetical protein